MGREAILKESFSMLFSLVSPKNVSGKFMGHAFLKAFHIWEMEGVGHFLELINDVYKQLRRKTSHEGKTKSGDFRCDLFKIPYFCMG